MSLSVLALDPGPTRTGAALLELSPSGWPLVLRAGHLDRRELEVWLVEAQQLGRTVAVEQVQGYAYEASRVAQLVETARAEGWIDGRVRGASRLLWASAAEWREQLCGSKVASDDQIRLVVEGLACGLPHVGSRERPHVMDAVGLGIVALARLGDVTIRTPEAVLRALLRLQAEEKLGRQLKRASGSSTQTEKRRPTRSQTARRSAAAKRGWAGRA